MIERFIEFLKENDAYEKYKENVIFFWCNDEESSSLRNGIIEFDYYLKKELYGDPTWYFVSCLFSWDKTKEDWSFWSDIESKWNTYKHL